MAAASRKINDGVRGANYGYPGTEGYTPLPEYQSPRYAYDHSGGACAIIGGAFYTAGAGGYPAGSFNTYFFADLCDGFIRRLDPSNGNAVVGVRHRRRRRCRIAGARRHALLPVDRRRRGVSHRLRQSAAGHLGAPASQIASPGDSVTFSVVASGAGPFTYQWQRFQGGSWSNVGTNSASYTLASAQLSDNGARFRVEVANGGGNVFSNEAVLTVTLNQAPTPTIVQPTAGFHYTGGMTVVIAGTGTDPEDGALPPQAFTWRVDFHHDTHVHPFMPPTSGFAAGSFVDSVLGRDRGERVVPHLPHRDRQRRPLRVPCSATSCRSWRVSPWPPVQPACRCDSMDSRCDAVRVRRRRRRRPRHRGVRPERWRRSATPLSSWSDGGARGRSIQTPPVATTFTARFATVAALGPPGTPSGFAMDANGQSLRVSWNRVPLATSYQLEAGTGSGLSNLFSGDVGDVDQVETLVPSGTYFARVRALNAFGASARLVRGQRRRRQRVVVRDPAAGPGQLQRADRRPARGPELVRGH